MCVSVKLNYILSGSFPALPTSSSRRFWRINKKQKFPSIIYEILFFAFYKFSLAIHDLNGNRIGVGYSCWLCRRIGWLRCGDTSIISSVAIAGPCQQQTTCCAIASLFILQIDAAPCEIRIYYRWIVIPFHILLSSFPASSIKVAKTKARARKREGEKIRNRYSD